MALEYLYTSILAKAMVAYKAVKWVEETLAKHKDFALPGRKALLKSEMQYDVILIDATETPIERPKKTKTVLFRQEEKAQLVVR